MDKFSFKLRFFSDIISLFLTYLPVPLTYLFSYELYFKLELLNPLLIIMTLPFLCSFIFILITYIFRISLPTLRAGQYELTFSLPIIAWYCHLALNRSSKVLGFRYLINSFFILKYLHLRSLGAKVKFDLNTSLDFVVADLPLITIGDNCTIGHNVYLSCHLIKDNKLFLIPVKIGNNVSIGMNCVLGPGTRIGDNSKIDFGNNIYGTRLKENSSLGANEWTNGPPSKGHKSES